MRKEAGETGKAFSGCSSNYFPDIRGAEREKVSYPLTACVREP
jgi:hypothetical protein